MNDPLLSLRDLFEVLDARVQRARHEAAILLAKADAIECAKIDLDLAIDKAAAALITVEQVQA